MAPTPLKIAVVGLGVMGAKHVRCVAAHPGATLAAVVDIEPMPREAVAAEFNCASYATADGLAGQVDAAIVAVTTAFHADIATTLLTAGIACLVEKPFVSNAAEGARVAATAKARNLALQIGHIERFNPAMAALLTRVTDPTAVRTLTGRRISAASARVTDIDVVMDLMVHDIDAVLALKRTPVENVTATGDANHVQALITFSDGAVADLTASRALPGRIRDLQVVTDHTTFQMDYIARTLAETPGNQPRVYEGDALLSQLNAFIAAVRGNDVVVSATDAIAVMDVAWRVQAAVGFPS